MITTDYTDKTYKNGFKNEMLDQRINSHITDKTLPVVYSEEISINKYGYVIDFIDTLIMPNFSLDNLTVNDINELFEKFEQDDAASLTFEVLTNINVMYLFSVLYKHIVKQQDEHNRELQEVLATLLNEKKLTQSENFYEKIQDTLKAISNFMLVYAYVSIGLFNIIGDPERVANIVLKPFEGDFILLFCILSKIIENVYTVMTNFNEGIIMKYSNIDCIYESLFYVIDTIDDLFITCLVIGILSCFGIHDVYITENICDGRPLLYKAVIEQMDVFGHYDLDKITLFDLCVDTYGIPISGFGIIDCMDRIQYYIFALVYLFKYPILEAMEEDNELECLDMTITDLFNNEIIGGNTVYDWFKTQEE